MKKILYVVLISCFGFTFIISCGDKDEFKISELSVPKEKNRPEISLTIDTKEDFKSVKLTFCKILIKHDVVL